MRGTTIAALGLLLAGCAPARLPISCPNAAMVAPASIGGAKAVQDLMPVLAGPDRENGIAEAVHRFRRMDPTISDDAIIDVILAADCPDIRPGAAPDAAAERARIASVRGQVSAILAGQ